MTGYLQHFHRDTGLTINQHSVMQSPMGVLLPLEADQSRSDVLILRSDVFCPLTCSIAMSNIPQKALLH